MASFDLREKRMCIRVVYDGVAGAGKTTNLRQLASHFAAQRTTELYSPAEIEGRTLYFDWMQIHGGVVCGFPVLCQVISVPGQVVLTERRRHLLETADAVVYVCDSARDALEQAREGLAVLDGVSRGRASPPVLVVQGNKQDQAHALAGPRLLEAIERRDATLVEAIAVDGIGVVDTFVAAVRAVARHMDERVAREAVRVPVEPAQDARALLARMESIAIDPEGAAELLLTEVAAAYDARRRRPDRPSSRAKTLPPAAVDGAHAPFPRPDVPAGYVWPAHSGRARLDGLARPGDGVVPLDENGEARFVGSGFALRTSRRVYFPDADRARQGIVRAAREHTQLGALLAPETVLALQPVDDERSWLWTISPALPSAAAWLRDAGDGGERSRRVEAFAVAVGHALACAEAHGIALDTAASNFGVESDALRYVGDLAPVEPGALERMVAAALGAFDEHSEERVLFLERLERERARRGAAAPA